MCCEPVLGVVGHMHLSQRGGAITMLAEMRQETRQVEVGTGTAQPEVAVVVAILAAENTHAAGSADRALGVVGAESHTLAGQPVHIRRDDLGVPFAAHARRLVLIGDDDQHVHWSLCGHRPRRAVGTVFGECCPSRSEAETTLFQKLSPPDVAPHELFPFLCTSAGFRYPGATRRRRACADGQKRA